MLPDAWHATVFTAAGRGRKRGGKRGGERGDVANCTLATEPAASLVHRQVHNAQYIDNAQSTPC